ncbi:hypothetical protein [Streptomyces venezuelae]|nr:hypothetical protein [Streptomyces venezuelae]
MSATHEPEGPEEKDRRWRRVIALIPLLTACVTLATAIIGGK